jgi:FAD/FMN-containing dehydrogenase
MRPTRSMLERLRDRLHAADVLAGEALSSRPSAWSDPTPLAARAYVTLRSTEDVSAVLQLSHEFGRPVVVHGGMTGLAVPMELIATKNAA